MATDQQEIGLSCIANPENIVLLAHAVQTRVDMSEPFNEWQIGNTGQIKLRSKSDCNFVEGCLRGEGRRDKG